MTELRTVVPDEIDRYLDALVRTGPFSNKAELVRAALISYSSVAQPLAGAFDKENIFSPDGRIYQIEYARESSKRGAPIAGAVYDKGVVLGARYFPYPGAPISSLAKPWGKIARIGKRMVVAGVGLSADFGMLVRKLEKSGLEQPEELVDHARDFFWEHTVRRDLRPLGTAVLLGTLGEEGPQLQHLDASGSVSRVDAVALGMGIRVGDEGSPTDRIVSAYRPGRAKDAEATVRQLLGGAKELDVLRLEL
jgi:hypothetical protein